MRHESNKITSGAVASRKGCVLTLNDLAMFYLGMGMLPMLLSARAIAISINHKRLPTLRELFSSELDISEKEQKWLRIAKRIFVGWVLLFLVAWLLGVHEETDMAEGEGVRGIILITVFHTVMLGQTLRSVLFNIEHYDSEKEISENNSQFWRVASIFPGFKDPIRLVISLTATVSASMLIFVFLYF